MPNRRFDCLAVIDLRLDDGSYGAQCLHFLATQAHAAAGAQYRHQRDKAPTALTVRSDIFAKSVYLFHPDKAVIFDDNYFDLLPGETVTVRATKPLTPAGVTAVSYHH